MALIRLANAEGGHPAPVVAEREARARAFLAGGVLTYPVNCEVLLPRRAT